MIKSEKIQQIIKNDKKVLTGFDHSNLVKFFDIFKDESRIYQILEFCNVNYSEFINNFIII